MTLWNMTPSAFPRNLLPHFQGSVKKEAVGSCNTLADPSYQNTRSHTQHKLLMSSKYKIDSFV
jgi:hypothetical protein